MSRSRRKTPISGVTGSQSNKKFKSMEHRRERRNTRQQLLWDHEGIHLPHYKTYGNEWDSPRDGKMWFGDCKYGSPKFYWFGRPISLEEFEEQQKEEYKRLMRK